MQTGHFAAARAGWTRSRHLTAHGILRAWRIYWGSMAKAAAAAALMGAEVQRIDKYLWFARLAKNRSVAQAMAETGHIRVNGRRIERRSEEHTSELQSLMRISYAVFCLKKKNNSNEQ